MAVSVANYLLSSLAATLLYLVFQPLFSPLRSIPGPILARFTKLWYLHQVKGGQFHWRNIALHEKHGKVVRYTPNAFSISDPEAIKTIYAIGTNFGKSDWYLAWTPPGAPQTIFTTQDNKMHGQLRRKFQSPYSMSSMVQYEAATNDCTKLFCQRLDEAGEMGQTMDLAWWFMCYASDFDTGEDVGHLVQNLHTNLAYTSQVGIYAALHPIIFLAIAGLAWLGIGRGTGGSYLRDVTAEAILERRKDRTGDEKLELPERTTQNFLTKFIEANDADPDRFTEADIYIGLLTNVVAGADTTMASMTAVMYHLLKTPHALAKLREEIAAHGHTVETDDQSISFKQAQSMPYLQAVILEGLRLHPAVGLPLERVVPAGGAELCGHSFPAGTVVGVNAWAIHYSPSLWGPDVATFRPERWIESDAETVSAMHKNWLPFGLGSRACIGRHVSMLEMNKLIPELVRRFDFRLDEEALDKGERLESTNHWFVIPKSLKVRVQRRKA